MNIVFDRTPGVIADLEFSLFMIYNSESFEAKVEKYGVKLEKSFFKTTKQLSKLVDCSRIYMEVFYSTDIYGGEDQFLGTPCFDAARLWKIRSNEEVVEFLNGLTDEEIKHCIIKELVKIKKCDEKLDEILVDNKKIVELIQSLECNASTKWSLFTFLNDTKKYMNEYILFLTKYMKVYEEVLIKTHDERNSFNNYVEENLKDRGEEFLKEISGGIWNYNGFDYVYVTTLNINSISCSSMTEGDKLYIFIGANFQQVLKQIGGGDKVAENVNLFKGLSDMTRFKILTLLIEKEVFGQEIADAVNVSMATVNYHMTFLLSTQVVQLKRKGQKTYYSLNKERLIESIEFIKNTFNLEF